LTFVNASNVPIRERREAEKSYVRRVAREISQKENEQPAAAAATEESKALAVALSTAVIHPRYAELLQEHGESLSISMGGTGAHAFLPTFVDFLFCCCLSLLWLELRARSFAYYFSSPINVHFSLSIAFLLSSSPFCSNFLFVLLAPTLFFAFVLAQVAHSRTTLST
jgi:hypothetical protein